MSWISANICSIHSVACSYFCSIQSTHKLWEYLINYTSIHPFLLYFVKDYCQDEVKALVTVSSLSLFLQQDKECLDCQSLRMSLVQNSLYKTPFAVIRNAIASCISPGTQEVQGLAVPTRLQLATSIPWREASSTCTNLQSTSALMRSHLSTLLGQDPPQDLLILRWVRFFISLS